MKTRVWLVLGSLLLLCIVASPYALFHVRVRSAWAALSSVSDAVREYKDENGTWPRSLAQLGAPSLLQYRGIQFSYDPHVPMVALPIEIQKPSILHRLSSGRLGSLTTDGNFAMSFGKTFHDEVLAAPPAPPQKPAPETNPLGCSIRAAPTCQLGRAPKVTVALTNRTDADIYLVGSLDASDCKWRYPHCYFEVIGPDGKSAVQAIARGCGNMDPLEEEHFAKVPPGGAFDPYQRTDDYRFFSAHQLRPSTFRTAGEYRIRFVYSTNSDALAEWGGGDRVEFGVDERQAGMLRRVPKVKVRSNEIKVTVVEPGK